MSRGEVNPRSIGEGKQLCSAQQNFDGSDSLEGKRFRGKSGFGDEMKARDSPGYNICETYDQLRDT
jgi:hypothetical protein